MAIGPIYVYRPEVFDIFKENSLGCVKSTEVELRRLEIALEEADRQLKEVFSYVRSQAGLEEARLFEAHRLILRDPLFRNRIEALIRDHELDAATAVARAGEEIVESFDAISDDRFRARAADLRDVCRRLIRIVQDRPLPDVQSLLAKPSIICASDLLPSDTTLFNREYLLGFITEMGGPTSHVAILARSFGIPAVVGISRLCDLVHNEMMVIVDGGTGVVVLNPTPDETASYCNLQGVAQSKLEDDAVAQADGHSVVLRANVGHPNEVEPAIRAGAAGIGLLRTEFLFLGRGDLPNEEEQARVYREVVAQCKGYPLTVRALDAGGDKPWPWLERLYEPNPFLGLRGLRFLLRHRDVLRTQVRAVHRASAYGPRKLMFPMVTTAEEFEQVRAIGKKFGVSLNRKVIYSTRHCRSEL